MTRPLGLRQTARSKLEIKVDSELREKLQLSKAIFSPGKENQEA